jgi:voltage-gated potassium channel
MRHPRRHLTLPVAIIAVAGTTMSALAVAALLVTLTDPAQFTTLEEALWWAASTITTVGYGDIVPVSSAGRLVGAVLMFVGIACLALLTAIAASAIVVGRVRPGEEQIARAEQQIEREEGEILARLDDLARRLESLEQALTRPIQQEAGPSPGESREGAA